MNKIFTYFLIWGLALSVYTAKGQRTDTVQSSAGTPGKNLVKINLTAIPLNNYSFQYERAIGGKISVALGLRFMPKSGIPLKSLFKDLVDDEDLEKQIDNFKTGNFAITPEVRFYMGKGVFRGFYLAPFVRYSRYTASVPYQFDYDHPVNGPVTETIALKGSLTTITGGVLIGAQWKLSKLVYLDWWILGPQYGTSNGSINGTKNLSAEEQEALREELKELEDLPLVKVTSTVNSTGAKVDFKGPWAGLRAGINLGFRF